MPSALVAPMQSGRSKTAMILLTHFGIDRHCRNSPFQATKKPVSAMETGFESDRRSLMAWGAPEPHRPEQALWSGTGCRRALHRSADRKLRPDDRPPTRRIFAGESWLQPEAPPASPLWRLE